MAALPLTTHISQASQRTTSFRTLKMSFGNGYEQRTPDGFNATIKKFTLVYDNLIQADRDTLNTFLNSVGMSTSFTYTPIGESTALKFVVDGDIQETALSGNIYSITFPIRQVFDL